jgi:hypothetical protein
MSGGRGVPSNAVDPAGRASYLQGMSQTRQDTAFRRANLPLLAAALVGGALFAAAVGLWLHYGTAVFFEIVRAGIAACF